MKDQVNIMHFDEDQKKFLTGIQVVTIKNTYKVIQDKFTAFTPDECLMILGSFAQQFDRNIEQFLLRSRNIVVESGLNIELEEDFEI